MAGKKGRKGRAKSSRGSNAGKAVAKILKGRKVKGKNVCEFC